ncbi:MAG TPA: cyclic-di-AMP receptor, partial [Anaerolineae bacterium]|nr:cyclic-di-AMP receptor [Anaerolineae bacterium]
MKLIVAIVQDADAGAVLDALMAQDLRATKVSSTGG